MNDKYALMVENPKYCQRLFGVKYDIFEYILKNVQKSIDTYLAENPLSNRGISSDFSIENRSGKPSSVINFRIFKTVSTFLSLGFLYGISESYANKIYHKIRPILAETVGLKNPKKLKFKHIQKVIIDVTLQPIERPKIEQNKYCSDSKKAYS